MEDEEEDEEEVGLLMKFNIKDNKFLLYTNSLLPFSFQGEEEEDEG